MRRIDADDASLLLAAANGDDRAFAALYRRWLPVVTGYQLRRTRSRELAFDLTAETFAAVVADLSRTFRGSIAAVGPRPGWLLEIAEHKLLDSLRRSKVESWCNVGGCFVAGGLLRVRSAQWRAGSS